MSQETRVTVRGLLKQDAYKKSFEEVLGSKAPQFVASISQTAQSTLLMNCDPKTVIGAAYTAACLDLPIDKNLGFAHIVPYAGKAQFQMGYKGYIQLALRSGQYAALNDFKVNKAAFISYDYRSSELKLDQNKLDEYDEDVVGYAFYFKLITGFEKTVYWTKEKIIAHAQRYSQAFRAGRKDSPWFTKFDTMALKTVISNTLRKYGILTVQMQTALKFDQAIRSDITQEVEPIYPDGTGGTIEGEGSFIDNADGGQGEGEQPEPPKKEERILSKITGKQKLKEEPIEQTRKSDSALGSEDDGLLGL